MAIMTEDNRTAELTTDGVETEFDFAMLIHADSEVQVWYEPSGGEYELLTLDTDYTVSFTEDGGTVTTIGGSSPRATGKILIIRNIELTQESNWLINDNHSEQQHQDDFDRSVMRDLQIQEQLDRCLQFDPTSPTTDVGLPEPEALKHLRWNAGETAIENVDVSAGVLVQHADLLDIVADPDAVDGHDGRYLNLSGENGEQQNIQWDLTPSLPPTIPAEGLMYWNEDEGTLNLGMPGGHVNYQLGQELYLPRKVKNTSGSDMKNGDLVFVSGGNGINAFVALAKADAEATSATTIAMLTEDIDNNQFGYATTYGLVRGEATQPIDTNSFAPGTELFLSAGTAGEWTSTRPPAPNHGVSIGIIFRQHVSEGIICVKIINGLEITELHDVLISALANNELLVWDSASGTWQNTDSLTLASLTMTGDLDMGFNNITNPDNMDASVDPTAITDPSETLFWTLNGVLTATTGGVDLVEQSGPTEPDYVDRGTFKAWDGDGTLYFKAAGVEGPLGANARTTLAWVKTETSGAGNKTIIDYGNTGVAERWQFFINTTTNIMTVGIGGSSATSVADARVSDGEWHMFAVTLEGGAGGNESDEIIFTIDCDVIANNTSPGVTINTVTDTDTFVGANQAAGNRMPNPMGLVAIFDVGLTTELDNIFNRTKERKIEGTSLPDPRDMADDISTLGKGHFGDDLDTEGNLQVDGDGNVDGNFTAGSAPGNVHLVRGTTTFGDTGGGPGTGAVVVEDDGDMTFVAGGGVPYGHMYVDGTQAIRVALTLNTPTEVKDDGTTSAGDGWLAGDLHLFSFPTGGTEHYITITEPGVYHITWNLSFKMVTGAANTQIHGGLTVDSTTFIRDKCEAHRTISNNTDTGNMAGACLVTLPNGNEELSLWMENTTNNNDAEVVHGSLVAFMVGGT